MSDAARKRTLADWVVKTKKQIVKLYAVTKWSRDANTVQKCMVNFIPLSSKVFTTYSPPQNITAFLLTQNQQFEDVIEALKNAKVALDPARYDAQC